MVDGLWLYFWGSQAPTPVDGLGFARDRAPRLRLLEVNRVEDEVFLHYQVQRDSP